MVAASSDRALIGAIQGGLPLCPRPYARIAERLGVGEEELIRRLEALLAEGTVKRLGVVVRHRSLGYRANAMVVWDVPDEEVDALGVAMGESAGVSLCYRRPRRLPRWRYNLFCMIHGRCETEVRRRVQEIAVELGVPGYPRELLFSKRCFKQKGAEYVPSPGGEPRPGSKIDALG